MIISYWYYDTMIYIKHIYMFMQKKEKRMVFVKLIIILFVQKNMPINAYVNNVIIIFCYFSFSFTKTLWLKFFVYTPSPCASSSYPAISLPATPIVEFTHFFRTKIINPSATRNLSHSLRFEQSFFLPFHCSFPFDISIRPLLE